MWFESQVHQGSTFYFTISVPFFSDMAATKPNQISGKLLLIENNEILSNVLIRKFKQMGLTATSVPDISQAKANIENSSFDVVVIESSIYMTEPTYFTTLKVRLS